MWRGLALLVMYGHVEMGVGIAVIFAANLRLSNNISFAPVVMALCVDSYHSHQPMYCTVALFLCVWQIFVALANQRDCLIIFPVLT